MATEHLGLSESVHVRNIEYRAADRPGRIDPGSLEATVEEVGHIVRIGISDGDAEFLLVITLEIER